MKIGAMALTTMSAPQHGGRYLGRMVPNAAHEPDSAVAAFVAQCLIRPSAWWRTMAARHREVLHAVFAPLPAPAVKGYTNQARRGKRSPTSAALRYPGEWISDPSRGPALRDRAQAQLLDALRSPLGVGCAVGSMRQLGTFYQLAGQAAVLAGDTTGWQMVRLGFRFAATAVHLSDRLFVADPRPDKPPRTDEWQVGHCVALGLALDVPATDRTFEIFQRRMQSGTLGAGRGAFARYLAALCQLHVGSSDANELEACDLGPWHELFTAWASYERFAAAMLTALAYHVERATPSSRHLGEFEGGPEQAFAAELVAVTRMREASGLATPFIDHPLWQTPLVATRPTWPWPEDELLSRCMAFADEVQPPHPDELLAAIPNPGVRGGLGSRLRRTFSRWFGGTS